jgi:UDP-N-acetylglucosamine 2-epimerase
VELLPSRANRLAGADRELIVKYSNESMMDPIVFNKDLYGNGRASENIVKYIQRDYGNISIATVN